MGICCSKCKATIPTDQKPSSERVLFLQLLEKGWNNTKIYFYGTFCFAKQYLYIKSVFVKVCFGERLLIPATQKHSFERVLFAQLLKRVEIIQRLISTIFLIRETILICQVRFWNLLWREVLLSTIQKISPQGVLAVVKMDGKDTKVYFYFIFPTSKYISTWNSLCKISGLKTKINSGTDKPIEDL